MGRTSKVIATCRLLPAGEPPEWVELLPGRDIVGVDGRRFQLDAPAAVIAAFAARKVDLVLDWEHASEILAPAGHPAPAAGWIRELELRGEAIWGRVDWTPRGAESIRSREYRYLSPAFMHDKLGSISELVSVGLTNQPNLDLPALNRAQSQEDNMLSPELLALLGLAATASEADVGVSIKKLNADLQVAKNRAEVPPLDKFVPRADYDAALNRAGVAETKLVEREKAEREKEIEALIAGASAAGKITPATADYYRGECRQAGGVERFRAFLEKAPVVVADTALGGKPPAAAQAGELSEAQLAVCRALGLTPETFKKTTI